MVASVAVPFFQIWLLDKQTLAIDCSKYVDFMNFSLSILFEFA